MATEKDSARAFLQKARVDVETFLKAPTTILPEFPATMTELRLDEIGIRADQPTAMEISEVLGRMYMMGVLADILTTMFAEDGGVVGSSSWIRDVLISESTRAAIATRFNWTSPKIDKALIIYHMIATLHDSETIESGEEDLERWAGEFFRQLARVANRTRQPAVRNSVKGIYVLSPAFVHVANDLRNDKRPLACIQMEEYLRRQRGGEQIPMVPGWVEDHEVVKQLLKGDA
ncbi:hypothetical protein FB451DRAFT_1183492 [Mycena latifolia]|nr:hypothetical protein FB451DRAFT_1183492 [Mycena latifolia]